MDHPIDFDRVPESKTPFSTFDSHAGEPLDEAGFEGAGVYAEIAERRAQLECAETLRRVRAL
jgi:hypothetical protein